jgi:hypothetical protein
MRFFFLFLKRSIITACLVSIGALSSVVSFGASSHIGLSPTPRVSPAFPALVGGIDESQLKRCTDLINTNCQHESPHIRYPIYNTHCTAKYFSLPLCRQSRFLHQYTKLMLDQAKHYNQMSVISVSRYRYALNDKGIVDDPLNHPYIVDASGRIINLVGRASLSGTKNSQALLAKYPNAMISGIVIGDPTYILLPDKTQRLIFTQAIFLHNTYASRTNQWQAQVSYAFSPSGVYTGFQRLGVIGGR